MKHHWLSGVLAAGLAVTLAAAASAQQPQRPRAAQGSQQPQLRDDEQILPSQIVRPPSVTQSMPAVAKPPAEKPAVEKPAAAQPPQPAHAVTCSSGAFAKDSGHLKLAMLFGAQNVEYKQVSGDEGSTLLASVLYPRDPKRRLEVLWDDETARVGTRMIVIDGQSTWTAEKGLHLGLPLAALEKLNGKPFKLKGFGRDGLAMITDWDGGAFDQLSDGCKVGVRLKPDPKASTDARNAARGDQDFVSGDAAIRAAKPSIGEIIVGY
jgi:hypothetical protein